MLMATAPDGQRRPGLSESADLVRSGVWMRLRPSVPRSARTVRAAVKLMYAGAAVSTVNLIIGLALIIVDITAAARGQFLGHSLTTPQMRPFVITVWIVFGLAGVSLWLWMARANGQGRNWARIMSTVLFVLATLQLGHPQPLGSPAGFGVTVLYYGVAVLSVAAWLVGGAAVWLLWRPASTAFFKPPGSAQALHQWHMAELDRIRSSRAQMPRHV